MSKVKIFLLLFFIPLICSAQPMNYTNPPLNIEEEDGSPSTFPYKLKVPNTSLTDNLDETSSLDYGKGIGGAMTAGSVVFSDGTTLTEDNPNLFWDDTNNHFKVKGDIIYHGVSFILDGMGEDRQDMFLTTSGGNVFFETEKLSGGDIEYIFDEIEYDLDCTTGAGTGGRAQAQLTEGTSTTIARNYVYVELDTGVATLKASTSLPSGEFAWMAIVGILTDTQVDADGALVYQRFTETLKHDETAGRDRGALSYQREKLRWLGAQYLNGVAQTLTITANGGSADNVVLTTALGKIFQLHRQDWPAYDLSTDGIWVANALSGSGGLEPYDKVTDLNALLETSAGVVIGNNKRFSLVIWGSINFSTGDCKMFVNLPTDTYVKDDQAIADRDNTAVTTIPEEFQTTGFLIARIPLKYQTASSGTWTNLMGGTAVIDLRGIPPGFNKGTGGGIATNSFNDADFEVYDNGDSTKIIKFQASGISTGTTRTLTVPNVSDTIAVVGTDNSFSAKQTFTSTIDATGALIENSDNEDLVLRTNANANQLVLDSGGSVGIGTTAPGGKLEIREDESSAESSIKTTLAANAIVIDSDFTTNRYLPGLVWNTANNNDGKPKGGIWMKTTDDGSELRFGTSNSYATGITNTGMMLNEVGWVGVGNVNPGSRLNVTISSHGNPPSLGFGFNNSGFTLSSVDNNHGLYTGIVSNGNVWLQVTRNDTSAIAYDLLLNPSGGDVAIGDATTAAMLDIGGGTATTIDGTDDLLVKDDLEVDGNIYGEGDITLIGSGPDFSVTPTGGDTVGWHFETIGSDTISIFKNETDSHQYWRSGGSNDIFLNPYAGSVSIGGGQGFDTSKELYVNGDVAIIGTLYGGSDLDIGSDINMLVEGRKILFPDTSIGFSTGKIYQGDAGGADGLYLYIENDDLGSVEKIILKTSFVEIPKDLAVLGTITDGTLTITGGDLTTTGTVETTTLDLGTNTLVDAQLGRVLTGRIDLPVQSAKISGTFITAGQGALIEGGEGHWHLDFVGTTADDEAIWTFRMPADYDAGLIAKIGYSMSTAVASQKIGMEVSVMATADGEGDVNTASFDTVNDVTGGTSTDATAGTLDEISITLSNNDSVAAGELVAIKLIRDADDDDTHSGDVEVLFFQLTYTL